jgi:hypothetical protein
LGVATGEGRDGVFIAVGDAAGPGVDHASGIKDGAMFLRVRGSAGVGGPLTALIVKTLPAEGLSIP